MMTEFMCIPVITVDALHYGIDHSKQCALLCNA